MGRGRPGYGVDSPWTVLLVGAIGGAGIICLLFGALRETGAARIGLVVLGVVAAVPGIAQCGLMVRSSARGKPRRWRAALDQLEIDPDARVLDVGCGRGAVTAEIARRLQSGVGHVVGVDRWRMRDLSGNTPAAAARALAAAGVHDRVTLLTGDARALPFRGGGFDAVVAGLLLRALPEPEDRLAALGEMVRVAAPGGAVVLMESGELDEEARHLAALGCTDVDLSPPDRTTYPSTRLLVATAPRGD